MKRRSFLLSALGAAAAVVLPLVPKKVEASVWTEYKPTATWKRAEGPLVFTAPMSGTYRISVQLSDGYAVDTLRVLKPGEQYTVGIKKAGIYRL